MTKRLYGIETEELFLRISEQIISPVEKDRFAKKKIFNQSIDWKNSAEFYSESYIQNYLLYFRNSYKNVARMPKLFFFVLYQ